MNARVADVGLVNQATTERVYGAQDAPSTDTGLWSDYDEIATDYDRFHSPVEGDEKVGLISLLREYGLVDSGTGPSSGSNVAAYPTVLDVGCGTGALLDLGITTLDRYTGVDPSRVMLHELLMKHNRSRIADVWAGRIEDHLASLAGQQFDLVIAAFGSATYISPAALQAPPRLAGRATVLMAYADGYLPMFHSAPVSTAAEASVTLHELAACAGTPVRRLGKFEVVVLIGSGDDASRV